MSRLCPCPQRRPGTGKCSFSEMYVMKIKSKRNQHSRLTGLPGTSCLMHTAVWVLRSQCLWFDFVMVGKLLWQLSRTSVLKNQSRVGPHRDPTVLSISSPQLKFSSIQKGVWTDWISSSLLQIFSFELNVQNNLYCRSFKSPGICQIFGKWSSIAAGRHMLFGWSSDHECRLWFLCCLFGALEEN